MLGDRTWDEFDLTDDNGQDFLFAKIAFSLFGPAPPAPDSDNIVVDNPNHHTYTDEQVAKVTNMQEKITKHQSPTKVSIGTIHKLRSQIFDIFLTPLPQ